jgi:hypothetical protein
LLVIVNGWAVALFLWAVALSVLLYGFLNVGGAVAGEGADASASFSFLGLPLFFGFRSHNLHGMRVKWGIAVMLIAPPVAGVALAVYQLRRELRSSGRRASR